MSDKKTNELKELTTISGFAALSNMEMLNEFDDDLAGLELTFDRIKIPAGGSTAFEIPVGDGEDTQMVKDVTGVILLHHPAYAFYNEKYAGGSNPPDCGSFDGITGNGSPGGQCATCPNNQYGSGEGQGKACKNRRMIYILMECEMFPMVLSLPTGSLKEFTKYVKRQLSKGRRLSQIVTKVSLKKATSSSGIAFSQAVFTFDRALDPDEKNAISSIVTQVKEYAANLSMSALMPDDEIPFADPETGEIIEPLR
ncbi:hypothetical protein Q5O24_07195 [Eubacteriaceae bacterium ES3]|nr:hypothetical protein Q5O24_07195 [Eubacteriaceae bacterium ES3]